MTVQILSVGRQRSEFVFLSEGWAGEEAGVLGDAENYRLAAWPPFLCWSGHIPREVAHFLSKHRQQLSQEFLLEGLAELEACSALQLFPTSDPLIADEEPLFPVVESDSACWDGLDDLVGDQNEQASFSSTPLVAVPMPDPVSGHEPANVDDEVVVAECLELDGWKDEEDPKKLEDEPKKGPKKDPGPGGLATVDLTVESTDANTAGLSRSSSRPDSPQDYWATLATCKSRGGLFSDNAMEWLRSDVRNRFSNNSPLL